MAPPPVPLTGKFFGQRSLAGYSPWGHKELDMTQHAHRHCVPQAINGTRLTCIHSPLNQNHLHYKHEFPAGLQRISNMSKTSRLNGVEGRIITRNCSRKSILGNTVLSPPLPKDILFTLQFLSHLSAFSLEAVSMLSHPHIYYTP